MKRNSLQHSRLSSSNSFLSFSADRGDLGWIEPTTRRCLEAEVVIAQERLERTGGLPAWDRGVAGQLKSAHRRKVSEKRLAQLAAARRRSPLLQRSPTREQKLTTAVGAAFDA